MNKQIFSLLFTAALMICCAGLDANASALRDVGGNTSALSSAGTNAVNVSGIEGNEWKLIEVYVDGRNTLFNRNTLPAEPGNIFTVNFDAQTVSGVGAPNRYSAPYTLGDNQAISIMLIRSTLMASLFQPENLSEHDFFIYLQNAYLWKLDNNKLELLSKTGAGVEVRLIFSL